MLGFHEDAFDRSRPKVGRLPGPRVSPGMSSSLDTLYSIFFVQHDVVHLLHRS
jgi:hypothetical protein